MEDTKKPTYRDYQQAFNDRTEALKKVNELKKAVENLEINLMFGNDFTNIDTIIKEIKKQVSVISGDDFYALCNGFTWGYLNFQSENENIKPEEIQDGEIELEEPNSEKNELQKYLDTRKSRFNPFKDDILCLYHNGAMQASIIQFLKDNGVSCTPANLSQWLKRHASKAPFVIKNSKKED